MNYKDSVELLECAVKAMDALDKYLGNKDLIPISLATVEDKLGRIREMAVNEIAYHERQATEEQWDDYKRGKLEDDIPF